MGLIAIVLAAFVLGMPSLFYPLSPDHGIIGTVGYALLEGGVPYKDVWDFKPPAIFFLYALSGLLLGKQMIVIRILDLVWQTFTALVVCSITRKVYVHKAAGPIAGVLYLFGYYSWSYWDTAQSDNFLSLPLGLSVLLILKARRSKAPILLYALAGLSIAIATLFKYPVGIFLPVAMVIAALSRGTEHGRARAEVVRSGTIVCGIILFGFLVPLALCWMFFWLRGAWEDMVYVQFILSPRLARESPLAKSIFFYLSWAMMIPGPAYKMLAALSAAVIVWLFLRKQLSFGIWLIVAWLGVALCSLLLQARFWGYHYQPLIPPMAILGSLGLHSLYLERRLAKESVALALSVILLLPYFRVSLASYKDNLFTFMQILSGRKSLETYYASYGKGGSSVGAALEIAKFVSANTSRSDKIQVWGHNALVYMLARRMPASRFIWNEPLYATWALEQHKIEFIEALHKQAPKYFIVWKNDSTFLLSEVKDDSLAALEKFRQLKEFIRDRYTIVRDEQNYRIFELKNRYEASENGQCC
jgi:4-amino-4-deoxy-L-arabinose transferase-like glycosyltransferase